MRKKTTPQLGFEPREPSIELVVDFLCDDNVVCSSGLMKTASINIAGIGSIRHISTARDRIVGIVFVTRLVSCNILPAMNVWIP